MGKTDLCLSLAGFLHSPIISADSRQMYRDIPVGTAAPTPEQLKQVKHFFIGNLALDQYYSAATYEEECIGLLDTLFESHDTLLMTGGSMMYIDAICKGIDDIPTISEDIRQEIRERYERVGLDAMAAELKLLDPEYWAQVDLKNPKRIIHALEICYMSGGTYTALRKGIRKERPFRIVKIALNRDREELFSRINSRVDAMMANGLWEEAEKVYPFRHLNSLNTVGFKELFDLMDGALTPEGKPQTMEYALDKIRRNTRVYAKKQITWFKRDPEVKWFHADAHQEIMDHILGSIGQKE